MELTDIAGSLAGLIALIVFLRVWKPTGPVAARERLASRAEQDHGDYRPTGHRDTGRTDAATSTTTTTHHCRAGHDSIDRDHDPDRTRPGGHGHAPTW